MTQLYRLSAMLGVLFFFVSAEAQLTADFTYSDSTGCGTLQVGFCDVSINNNGTTIVSRVWNLGGAPATDLTCPNRVFGTPGTYSVCLTVTDDAGNTDIECKYDLIKVFHLPTPEFTGNANDKLRSFGCYIYGYVIFTGWRY